MKIILLIIITTLLSLGLCHAQMITDSGHFLFLPVFLFRNPHSSVSIRGRIIAFGDIQEERRHDVMSCLLHIVSP